MTYTDIMVDLETLGTGADACVISLGAIKFNINEIDNFDAIKRSNDRFFIEYFNMDDQIELGASVTPETIKWWLKQSDRARKFVYEKTEYKDTIDILEAFAKFCKGSSFLWGNGAAFDNTIIRTMYRTFDTEFPISYSGDRCYRTLVALTKNKPNLVRFGVHHNCLDDAITQALYAQQCFNSLGVNL